MRKKGRKRKGLRKEKKKEGERDLENPEFTLIPLYKSLEIILKIPN